MRRYQMFIDGAFVDHAGPFAQVINPATEEAVAEYPVGGADDVDRAVAAAARAQPQWAARTSIDRAGHLTRIAAAIRQQADALARVLTEEQGKIPALARTEVLFTADYIDYMAGFARRIEGEIVESDRSGENIFIFKKPIGVVAGILPWNFPFFLIARKMAPALVTGNTVVVKPSSQTPNNAFEFARIVEACKLPPGVFNLVTGSGGEVGAGLAGHPKVGMVSFTGSVAGGVEIMRAAAANVTKVSLELGGKAPAIITGDADLDLAVKAIHASRIINTGQVCNCVERVYVEETVKDLFFEKIVAAMEGTRYGNPLEEMGLDMGPLVSREQLEKVEAAVARAIGEGAKLRCGGKRAEGRRGFHFEPTVLTECDHDSDIMRQEIFGPVLPITTYGSLDEAIAMANDSDYGLTSSIYTSRLDVALRAANELKFGETYVNRENFEAMQGFHAGWRKSGIGGADGRHGLEEFLLTHAVYMQYNPAAQ